jgi:nitrogenase molybdenum-cofactor synthesis protein NifE
MDTPIESRKAHIHTVGKDGDAGPRCEKHSVAGAVSQRACVFCGSRVVLYPVADALHLVHGPIGCAAYTSDIRGSLSSGPELHRLSFSTDLRENEVVHGGEKRLTRALDQLVTTYHPNAAFIYGTCIAGLIGDDLEAVCKAAGKRHGIPVIPVEAPGFAGTKKTGYQVACDALARLVGTGETASIPTKSINILGDFNLAGETWMIADYYRRMGLEVIATITGDGRVADIARSHGAGLNVVQCSGSMMGLAKTMEKKHGVPFKRVSYIGCEDTAQALYDVADFLDDDDMRRKAEQVVAEETSVVLPQLRKPGRNSPENGRPSTPAAPSRLSASSTAYAPWA